MECTRCVLHAKDKNSSTDAFISHMQVQANGEAVRLAQMTKHLGGLPWLDMKATNLTSEGMKCAVRNSKAFVLLLTSDVLTRPFCLLEINTAIDAGIPIIILREDDKRFFPWDFNEWKANKVWDKEQRGFVTIKQDTTEWKEVRFRQSSGTDTVWYNTKTGDIQVAAPAVVKAAVSGTHGAKGPYDAMDSGDSLAVRKLIERHRDKMLTIRRRDFEVEALVREIFHRTGHQLPQSTVTEHTPSDMTLTTVFAPGGSAVGGGEDVVKELRETTKGLGVKWVDNATATTFTIIILTGALLKSPALAKQVSTVLTHKRFLFLYSEVHGWDFGDRIRSKYPDIDQSLNDNEAMTYRPPTPSHLRFEHDAMVQEMFRRLYKNSFFIP